MNRTTTLENVVNDQLYLNNANENLRKSARPRLLEKINEKELKLKYETELFKGKQWVNKACETGTFPIKTANVDYHYYHYDHMIIIIIIIIVMFMKMSSNSKERKHQEPKTPATPPPNTRRTTTKKINSRTGN